MENVEMHHTARPYILVLDSLAAARRIAGPLLAVLAPIAGLVVLSAMLSMRIDLAPTTSNWATTDSSTIAPLPNDDAALAAPLDGLLSGH